MYSGSNNFEVLDNGGILFLITGPEFIETVGQQEPRNVLSIPIQHRHNWHLTDLRTQRKRQSTRFTRERIMYGRKDCISIRRQPSNLFRRPEQNFFFQTITQLRINQYQQIKVCVVAYTRASHLPLFMSQASVSLSLSRSLPLVSLHCLFPSVY